MTLAPLVDPSVRGVEGKAKLLPDKCIVPGCISLAQQRHHFWPKSFLRGQPYEWVAVRGHVIANSGGLCLRHHDWVTGIVAGGHLAHIRWNLDLSLLEWWEKVVNRVAPDDWVNRGPLRGQALVEPEPEARRVRREEGLCPTCGRAQPHEKRKTQDGLPKRKAKSWSLLVPDDEETGTEILDVYVEDLAILMGLDPESPRLLRYHVLVPVLEWVSQNKARFIEDWEEAAA